MSDIKALLTLWLLKAGTSSSEIRTSLQLAATSRAMATEDHAVARTDPAQPAPTSHAPSVASNIARLYPNSDAEIAARRSQAAVVAMNSDIMALITLSLLKIGTSSDEIQQALRLAALSRTPARDEKSAPHAAMPEPVVGAASMAFKQAALNELLSSKAVQGMASA